MMMPENMINMIQKHEALYNPKIEFIYEKIVMDMKIEELSGMCHQFI